MYQFTKKELTLFSLSKVMLLLFEVSKIIVFASDWTTHFLLLFQEKLHPEFADMVLLVSLSSIVNQRNPRGTHPPRLVTSYEEIMGKKVQNVSINQRPWWPS
jgi:hypothetical protein